MLHISSLSVLFLLSGQRFLTATADKSITTHSDAEKNGQKREQLVRKNNKKPHCMKLGLTTTPLTLKFCGLWPVLLLDTFDCSSAALFSPDLELDDTPLRDRTVQRLSG